MPKQPVHTSGHAQSIFPLTGELLAEVPLLDEASLDEALEQAYRAQHSWASSAHDDRVALLRSLAATLRANRDRYAELITMEMGKPLSEARSEIEKCAVNCEYYADNATDLLRAEVVASSARSSYVEFEPLGVVLAVMPWNYPFWQLFRFLAPALLAGNGVVLKHASNVPQCASAIDDAVREAGAPEHLFTNLPIESGRVARVLDDPRIAAVTLTGSTEVGRLVAAQAGRALKKQVLELGGSDPFIVLADADVDEAARVAVRARFQNAGQSCIAAKRFIVDQSIADAFTQAFADGVERLIVGDPRDEATNVGPMASSRLRDEIDSLVTRSIEAGARLVTGGHAIGEAGSLYAPTVLDHTSLTMPVCAEETFGPVAAIIRVNGVDEAIDAANSTEFGLGATLWTSSESTARAAIPRLQSGAVFVNSMVASDPRLPFGGTKNSGYGRELAAYGFREFTNIKTVWFGPTTTATRTEES